MTCLAVSASGCSQVHCLSATLEPHEDLGGGDAEVDLDAVAGSGDAACGLLDRRAEVSQVAWVDPVDTKQRGEGHPGDLCELGIGREREGYRVVPCCVAHRLSVPPGVMPAATIANTAPAGMRPLRPAGI